MPGPQFLVKTDGDRWRVEAPQARGGTTWHDSKEEALAEARRRAEDVPEGSVLVHDREGVVVEEHAFGSQVPLVAAGRETNPARTARSRRAAWTLALAITVLFAAAGIVLVVRGQTLWGALLAGILAPLPIAWAARISRLPSDRL